MKTWFITGASRGFGLLIARLALAHGDNVVATARQPALIVEKLGEHPQLLTLSLDVCDESAARQAVRFALRQFGRIDILVNNAGYGLLGAVEESSLEEVRRLYETNVFGLLNVTRAVLPSMRARRKGHVINMSSIGGYKASPAWGIYGSTKFAVEGITEALAQELGPLGIHVSLVEPGFFRTNFLDSSSLSLTETRIEDYALTAGVMREQAVSINGQQPGDPYKLAVAILVLVSSAHPPLRLPLGGDTVARIRAKHEEVDRELTDWLHLSLSTDHPPSPGSALGVTASIPQPADHIKL